MKIGIFGGTFDPFTVGHYEIVRKILNDKLVDKIVVLPTVVDYYRKDKTEMFDLADRKKIIEAWFKDNKDVILDFSEYDRAVNPRKYYDDPDDIKARRYFHMLNDMHKKYGINNCYSTILGGDSWNNLNTWYKWEELFQLSNFIVVKRDNTLLKRHFIHGTSGCQVAVTNVVFLDQKFVSVSATKIRERLHDMISGMSMGPATTCLGLYLEEVDDYLKTGKTYEDRKAEYVKMEKEAKKLVRSYFDKIDFDSIKREFIRKANSMKAYSKLEKLESNKNGNCLDESDELIAHTPIFDVLKAPEVEAGFRPVKIKSNDWITVVVEKNGKFLMEKQLRHGLNKEFEEFPCGIVEKNEHPLVAALRELKEETGISPRGFTIKYLGKYAANPAFMTNYMHYYHIELKDGKYDEVPVKLDTHEHLTSYWLDKNEAFQNFLNSEGSSIGGCCWMLLIKEGIINEWND